MNNETLRHEHIEMWKHYDNLRTKKNGSFLTGNSILVAISGFKSMEHEVLFIGVSILGLIICVSWRLLLKRNTDYINYHRYQASGEKEIYWRPSSKTPVSGNLDSILSVAFFVFWVYLLIYLVYLVGWQT